MKKIIICLVISLGIASLLLSLESRPFYQILDFKLYDLQMNLRTSPAQDPRILFVDMDEEAINNLGRWPWPRNIFTNIIDTLNSLGARQIILDVTFAQPNQVFINKEAVPHIFEGKDQIKNYIIDEAGTLKGKETVPAENAVFTLNQVQTNFEIFTEAAEKKLDNALTDNDKLLAEAFKNSASFIGYSFEVLNEAEDIKKDRAYLNVMSGFSAWIAQNPEEPFDSLPSPLKTNAYFNPEELKNYFLRAKMKDLIERNVEISLEKIAEELGKNPEIIEPEFYLVKHKIIEDKILSALENNPEMAFRDVIYRYEIFDSATQQSFSEVWSRTKKEFEAALKFAKPLPEGQRFFKAKKMEAPILPFTETVKNGGFLNGIVHQDGVLRSAPLFITYKNKIFPHIAIASILDLYKPEKISFDPGKQFVLHKAKINGNMEDVRIPIDEKSSMLINWAGRWKDTFRRISGADVYRLYFLRDLYGQLQNDPDQAAFLKTRLENKEAALTKRIKDSICIIGLTAAGTHDYNPIPYESSCPMVITHGNIINSILTKQFISKSPRSVNITILFACAVLIGICLPLLSSVHGLFFTIVVITGIFLGALYNFNQGLWLNLASPILMSLFSYLGITSYKFSTEERSKREIKRAFSKYVSPEVIEEIIQDPSKLQLGGDRRKLAVLFSDIRGFTTYSEKRDPEEIVAILNEYLDAMTNVIVEHKGTLDKYVGDEIMAVFGAPRYETPEISSQRAVTCAIKMLERLGELHEKWKSEGLEPLDIGIGINTGDMVVGNMGSELRMDYTVIGDAVNLGARVEALTRQFNTHLIITEATYVNVSQMVIARPLEAIKVKGKDIPVMIYEVTGLKEQS